MSVLIDKKVLTPPMASLALRILQSSQIPVAICADVIAVGLSLEAIAKGEHVVTEKSEQTSQ